MNSGVEAGLGKAGYGQTTRPSHLDEIFDIQRVSDLQSVFCVIPLL